MGNDVQDDLPIGRLLLTSRLLGDCCSKVKALDPIRASHVKQAFELYATRRHSLRSLLAELRRKGLTNRSGTPVTMCGLETMLNNPFYTGIIRIKRTGMTYRGAHERLITPNLFERVQAIKSDKSGPKVTRHDHTYRGLFRCGHCPAQDCPTKTVREEVLDEQQREQGNKAKKAEQMRSLIELANNQPYRKPPIGRSGGKASVGQNGHIEPARVWERRIY